MEEPRFALPCPDLGRWRDGNTGIEGAWRFESGRRGRDVLVTALVHGNELCGAWAVLGALEAGLVPRRGSLTYAFCNLAAFDRFDAAKPLASRAVDQDLNRLWGDMAWRSQGARTVEQRRVLELLPFVERADWLLDLHSMQHAGPPLVLTGLAPQHAALARRIGTPALAVADAGHAEGARMRDHGRWAPDRGHGDADACALLVECGFHGDLAARTVAQDVLARFLLAAEAIDEADVPAHWMQPLPPAQRLLRVTEAVAWPGGEPPRFAAPWRTGQRIEAAGTLLGWNAGVPFVTPYDGCTLIMPSVRHVKPGGTVVRLARDG